MSVSSDASADVSVEIVPLGRPVRAVRLTLGAATPVVPPSLVDVQGATGSEERAERRIAEEVEQVRRQSQQAIDRVAGERFELGHAEGLVAGRLEIKPALEHLSLLLRDIADQRDRILRDAEKISIQLALKIAEKVIRRETSLHPDLVLNVVGDAVRRVADKSHVVVRVSPDDVDRVEGYRGRLMSTVGGIGQIEVRPDPSVSRGECIVETAVELIDARFEEQLSRLEQVLVSDE